jgi:hypothetical protein
MSGSHQPRGSSFSTAAFAEIPTVISGRPGTEILGYRFISDALVHSERNVST